MVENLRRGIDLDLHLNGVTSLSEVAAKAFRKHKEGDLYLNGLVTLSANAAKHLAKRPGRLYLNGLTTLNDDLATSLRNHQDHLFLNGLQTLSDSAAESLSKHRGENVLFHILRNLRDKRKDDSFLHFVVKNFHKDTASVVELMVKKLGKNEGFDAIKMSSKENRAKYLTLNGLTMISDAAAKSLGQHDGFLELNGLTNISDTAVKHLGVHKQRLRLNGLTFISDTAAEILSRYSNRFLCVPQEIQEKINQYKPFGSISKDGKCMKSSSRTEAAKTTYSIFVK